MHACKYAYMHACENACIRYTHSFFQNSHTSVQVENAVLLLGFPIPSTAKIVCACLLAAIEPMVCANMYETKKTPHPALTHANTQKQAPRLQGDALDPAARCLNLLRLSTPTVPGTGHPCPQKKERRGCRKKWMGGGPGRWRGGGEGRESLEWESQRVVDGEGAKQKNIVMEKVDGTPSGNRTRVSPVAGEYSTTRPTVY